MVGKFLSNFGEDSSAFSPSIDSKVLGVQSAKKVELGHLSELSWLIPWCLLWSSSPFGFWPCHTIILFTYKASRSLSSLGHSGPSCPKVTQRAWRPGTWNLSIAAYPAPWLGKGWKAHLPRLSMHWILSPFLDPAQKHSSGFPCFQIFQLIHNFSYSSV